ncbi:thioesterase superfamily protein [Variibacter gotjawalensis]|uniref:Thioesterase superfamily protein n=1 Tax=Variibacter gotjawalensis TaxID=1333996 RepID=A0A0S3PS69_9BRAD|nr:PaaI family thioesterase [Variibacter gotjawalensis]NIK49055.1 uncharacterized protein (TIGR00369 family) [Variibacter gotjawalensis]RZS50911.1 uncharacterized protein (TIGR00369 family) [Variibacter gotjawalensis]BAT58745.1 thioesterase superfamily protein [Variibacter gotjawalensis]
MLAPKDIQYGVATPQQIAGLTGLETLQAMLAGKLPAPPISKTLNFILTEVGEGTCVFEGEPTAEFLNPMGGVHGGWALTILDSVTGCAGHSTLPPGVGYASIETKGNFSRAITIKTGRVRATGKVVSRGKQIISVEGRIEDIEGRILAHGTSTLMVFAPRG